MMWPQNYKEPNECKTVATAIFSALKNAGYKITAGFKLRHHPGLRGYWPGLNPFGWI